MRRVLPPAIVCAFALGAACTSFKGEDPDPSGDGGPTPVEGGTGGEAGTGGDGSVGPGTDDGGGGAAPTCTGQVIERTGFEKFPPDGWGENDADNLLGLDTQKSAGAYSVRAGPYKTNTRAMISKVVDLSAPVKARRFCLSVDLAIFWNPSVTGYVEILQVDLYPAPSPGPRAYIGMGVNADGLFVHFIGVGNVGDETHEIAGVGPDINFHKWTFTADGTGFRAWRDGVEVAHDAFPLPVLQVIDLSVGAQGGSESPRPNVTAWADELAATLLP